MVAMPFTYDIANGIGLGIVPYTLIRIGAGRFRETPPCHHRPRGAPDRSLYLALRIAGSLAPSGKSAWKQGGLCEFS